MLTLTVLLFGCNQPPGNPVDGKRWYSMHNCFACHGKNGNDGKGPKIAGLHMNHRGFVTRLRKSQSAIMPAYPEKNISNQDAADILAWLQSLNK